MLIVRNAAFYSDKINEKLTVNFLLSTITTYKIKLKYRGKREDVSVQTLKTPDRYWFTIY